MKRVRITLTGVVQGVGFRPFVYRLAREHGLAGFARNTAAGLIVEVEGDAVEKFAETVRADAPPLARVDTCEVVEVPCAGTREFVIGASEAASDEFAMIAPDVATCDACLGEIRDPADRRYGYPFTNCTDCGPRYTIVEDTPYDRRKTTMRGFVMCAACRVEYEDPGNRRYHAQPNACPKCGPSLSMPIAEIRSRLSRGEILAIKGLGGFHLACDAANREAVERLRRRKRRSEKPFALMCRDVEAARAICEVGETDRAALESRERPIVVMPRRGEVAAHCAPGVRTLGVMLPYTPLHHLLFEGSAYGALVMTSGNLSEEPIVVANGEARERLAPIADAVVTHDRDIYVRTDDSIVQTLNGAARVMRRSRGYAPRTIEVAMDCGEMLACGADLKNTFCLVKGRHAILSPHIGDLEHYETQRFYEETLANLRRLFRVTPRTVAHDLHPLYASTKFALSFDGVERVAVQHHHAHIASCMADNGLTGDVIGVAFDGTGYGTDGRIWGGEFLVARYGSFERRHHLRYFPLAGGDAAVREPWRAALALAPYAEIAGVPEASMRVVRRMIETGLNTVETSSCGRLFDAVAALLGVRTEATYEGQAAIELEAVADAEETGAYPRDGLDFRPAIEAVVRERGAVAVSTIAARFHNTVADAIVETCRRMSIDTGLRRVCLSGGTFQNRLLVGHTVPRLRAAGLEVFLHRRVPPNDGGIALGQAMAAARC